MKEPQQKSLRIDRWLWFTRFYKTRSLAAAAVAGGHVRVNGERARPGQRIAGGERISLRKERLPWELEVVGVPERRGPAREAARFYREGDAARRRREELLRQLKSDRQSMARTDGRPDKRTRRLLRQRNRGG